ncbi:MAG: hypothetical protein B9S34_09770 [Opitutia bacterium Tous-C1TDCM]|nr:MAG: hypothetical protein B9S34_09770 [Opitutae bacterium Tous-C1TDCM]
MGNFDSDGGSENQWEDRGELAWNEFDWERYLREQDESVERYLGFYQAARLDPERIDHVAEKMQWGEDDWSDDPETDDDDDDTADGPGEDVYTLHKNPIFIATKAIYLGLNRAWETLAVDSGKVPTRLAVQFLLSLQRGEEFAVQAIHALDFGDYAMAVSLFKRALGALNQSLALLNAEATAADPALVGWREDAFAAFFDLREVWLRVITECREEFDRTGEDED